MAEPPAAAHHAGQQRGDATLDEERGDGAAPPGGGLEFTANPLRSLPAARHPLKVAPERPTSSLSAPRSVSGPQRPHATRSLQALIAHVPWRSSRLGVHATLRITCLTPWQVGTCWPCALPWRNRRPSPLSSR